MNETTPEQMNLMHSNASKNANKIKFSSSDQAFPSLWIMGSAVILVVLLTVLSGWKIVNLEQERAQVKSERRLLERDKQAYVTIRNEIPALEMRQQNLTRELSDLEGKVPVAKARLESMTTQADAANAKLARATAERTEALTTANLCSRFMECSREGNLNKTNFKKFINEYIGYIKIFTESRNGISNVDIMEAAAVTESYKITYSNISNITFVDYLNTFYPDQNSTYRKITDLIINTFNPEIALELIPRICFLSLNGDIPAHNFWTFFDNLKLLKRNDIINLNAWKLSNLFRMDPMASLLNQLKTIINKGGEHKIFVPYMKQALELAPFDDLFEFAALPSSWLSGGGPDGALNIVPPFLLFSGGRGLKLGLAKTWSKDEQFMFFDAAALIGACQALLGRFDPYLPCPFNRCPVYRSSLCHSWFPVPYNVGWENCSFPKRLKLHFQVEIDNILELKEIAYEELQNDQDLTLNKVNIIPIVGKTMEEYRIILNEATKLTVPEEWDRRIISLLSEAEIDNLSQDLFDNTSYLVMSIAGYLLDMGSPLPYNCFNEFMDDNKIYFDEEYLLLFRFHCSKLGKALTPWFGLVLMRALRIIYRTSPNKSKEPDWLQSEIENYVNEIKFQRNY